METFFNTRLADLRVFDVVIMAWLFMCLYQLPSALIAIFLWRKRK